MKKLKKNSFGMAINYVYTEFKDCRGNAHVLIVAEDPEKKLSQKDLMKQAQSKLSSDVVKVDLNHGNYDNIYPFGDGNTLFLA